MDDYENLMAREKEVILLVSAIDLIRWDYETYMPPKGLMLRSEQLSLLTKLWHQKITDPEIGKLLDRAEGDSDKLDEVQKRNILLIRQDYDKETKIPEDLVSRIASHQPISLESWKKAKASNDWKSFEPVLQKTIDLARERAEIEMKVKGIPILYDTMLDEFERGITSSEITRIFGQLRDRLVPLTKKCAEASEDFDSSFLNQKVPIDIQRRIVTDLANLVGYDTY